MLPQFNSAELISGLGPSTKVGQAGRERRARTCEFPMGDAACTQTTLSSMQLLEIWKVTLC